MKIVTNTTQKYYHILEILLRELLHNCVSSIRTGKKNKTKKPPTPTGYCFRAISFFVSLSATLRENGWTDLHEIFREGVEWSWDDLIKFGVNSGKRVGGQRSICLLSPAIVQRTGVNKSVSFARWQQGVGFVVPRTRACFLINPGPSLCRWH